MPGQEGHPARSPAKRSLKLWPLACVIDEAQNLFAHQKYGKQAGEDAVFIIKIGRALGVFLILATQRPDKEVAAHRASVRQRLHCGSASRSLARWRTT